MPPAKVVAAIKGASRRTIFGPAEQLPKWMKKFRAMNEEEHENYKTKVTETEGFDVEGCSGSLPGRIVPICPLSNEWELAEIPAKFASADESREKPIEYKQLVKANIQPIGGSMYYLTFTGVDLKDNVEKVYRAKVWYKPVGGLVLVVLEEVRDGYQTAEVIREEITALLDEARRGRKSCESSPAEEKVERGLLIKLPDPTNQYVQCNAFWFRVKEMRSKNPRWKYLRVRKAASKEWKTLTFMGY